MTNKTEIIPAILPEDFDEISQKVEKIRGHVKTIQIDVCDGRFVTTTTWPYAADRGDFDRLLHEDEGLPAWQQVDYELDLMVNNAEKVVDSWILVGVSRIILHAEAKIDIDKCIEIMKGRVEIGLAFNIDTPIDLISKYRENIDFVQCMGIDEIGIQGQPFDERVVGKVRAIRNAHHGLPIAVDGGVSLESAPLLIAAGADRLVVGSALFKSESIVDTLHAFELL